MTSPPLLSRLGWPRPATPVHGHEVLPIELDGLGPVRLARWLHPDARREPVTLDAARVAALRQHLVPGDVALVIGAGEGAEALELGLAVGPGGAAVALEADQGLFPVLAANGALNRDRLRLLPHYLAVAGPGAPTPPHGVEAPPLLAFLEARHAPLLGRLRWVSLPFERHGPSLLEALAPLVAARRPLLRVRVGRTARRPQRQALLAFLGERGYRVERFHGDGGREAAPLTAANTMRWKRLDLLALP
jgi:hypothetical protein